MRPAVRRLGTAVRNLAAGAAGLAPDAAILGGAGLISYGVWQINHPAAFIVGGGFLLGFGWMFARRSASA